MLAKRGASAAAQACRRRTALVGNGMMVAFPHPAVADTMSMLMGARQVSSVTARRGGRGSFLSPIDSVGFVNIMDVLLPRMFGPSDSLRWMSSEAAGKTLSRKQTRSAVARVANGNAATVGLDAEETTAAGIEGLEELDSLVADIRLLTPAESNLKVTLSKIGQASRLKPGDDGWEHIKELMQEDLQLEITDEDDLLAMELKAAHTSGALGAMSNGVLTLLMSGEGVAEACTAAAEDAKKRVVVQQELQEKMQENKVARQKKLKEEEEARQKKLQEEEEARREKLQTNREKLSRDLIKMMDAKTLLVDGSRGLDALEHFCEDDQGLQQLSEQDRGKATTLEEWKEHCKGKMMMAHAAVAIAEVPGFTKAAELLYGASTPTVRRERLGYAFLPEGRRRKAALRWAAGLARGEGTGVAGTAVGKHASGPRGSGKSALLHILTEALAIAAPLFGKRFYGIIVKEPALSIDAVRVAMGMKPSDASSLVSASTKKLATLMLREEATGWADPRVLLSRGLERLGLRDDFLKSEAFRSGTELTALSANAIQGEMFTKLEEDQIVGVAFDEAQQYYQTPSTSVWFQEGLQDMYGWSGHFGFIVTGSSSHLRLLIGERSGHGHSFEGTPYEGAFLFRMHPEKLAKTESIPLLAPRECVDTVKRAGPQISTVAQDVVAGLGLDDETRGQVMARLEATAFYGGGTPRVLLADDGLRISQALNQDDADVASLAMQSQATFEVTAKAQPLAGALQVIHAAMAEQVGKRHATGSAEWGPSTARSFTALVQLFNQGGESWSVGVEDAVRSLLKESSAGNSDEGGAKRNWPGGLLPGVTSSQQLQVAMATWVDNGVITGDPVKTTVELGPFFWLHMAMKEHFGKGLSARERTIIEYPYVVGHVAAFEDLMARELLAHGIAKAVSKSRRWMEHVAGLKVPEISEECQATLEALGQPQPTTEHRQQSDGPKDPPIQPMLKMWEGKVAQRRLAAIDNDVRFEPGTIVKDTGDSAKADATVVYESPEGDCVMVVRIQVKSSSVREGKLQSGTRWTQVLKDLGEMTLAMTQDECAALHAMLRAHGLDPAKLKKAMIVNCYTSSSEFQASQSTTQAPEITDVKMGDCDVTVVEMAMDRFSMKYVWSDEVRSLAKAMGWTQYVPEGDKSKLWKVAGV